MPIFEGDVRYATVHTHCPPHVTNRSVDLTYASPRDVEEAAKKCKGDQIVIMYVAGPDGRVTKNIIRADGSNESEVVGHFNTGSRMVRGAGCLVGLFRSECLN